MKKKPKSILIVDDDVKYVAALKEIATEKRIQLDSVKSLAAMEERIKEKSNSHYLGVILDGYCYITKEDEENNVAKRKFANEAINLIKGNYDFLPWVILTGVQEVHKTLLEYFDNSIEEKTFVKGRDEEKALNKLVQLAQEKPDAQIREKYPKVFEIFKLEYLDGSVENELLGAIRDMNKTEWTEILNNLGRLRRIQEAIYIKLNSKQIIPDEYLLKIGDRVDIPKAYKYLGGQAPKSEFSVVRPYSIIDKFARTTYDVATMNGSHTPYEGSEEEIFYKPTKYTVQSSTYAMLDILLWFKNEMDNLP